MSHEQHTQLIQALNDCAVECNHCSTACLEEENVKMLERCIKLDMDSAEICRLAAAFLSRGSEHAPHILKECAEICNACAEECEKHAQHHDHCKRCAEACRKCAAACMASSAPVGN